MLKIFIGIIMVAISTFVGKKFTSKYTERVKFFRSLSDFNSALIRDLAYKKDGLLAALSEEYGYSEFDGYLKEVYKAYLNDSDIPSPPEFITQSDARNIVEYFKNIGGYGEVAEKDFLNAKREEFLEKTTELKEFSKKFSSLGSKLGFALGATLFIVIL